MVDTGTVQRTSSVDRVGAFSGVVYVLLANLGSMLVGVGPGGEGSPGQLMLDESRRIAENPWTRLAFAMLILAYLAWMVFAGYLCWRVRDGGWFATTALVGAIAAITVNLAATSAGLTVYLLREVLTPDIARALTDLDGIGHMLLVLPAGAFVLFVSAAALTTKVLGRVLSWSGIAIGATCIVVTAATALPSTEDLFLWPFLLVLLWMAVVSLRLGFARNRTRVPAVEAATVREG